MWEVKSFAACLYVDEGHDDEGQVEGLEAHLLHLVDEHCLDKSAERKVVRTRYEQIF